MSRYWFVVPAAGVGSRMQAQVPKQYLSLGDKTLLEHTIERLLELPSLAGIVVLVSAQDEYFDGLSIAHHPLVHRVEGGRERCDSVLNGLYFLADKVSEHDWVLVHDAARPCVGIADIQKLIEIASRHAVGGLLGIPVSDTIKHVSDESTVLKTLDRSTLWQAQTPQMFRYGILLSSLQQALSDGVVITDEASAIETEDLKPVMVEGRRDNIKVTRPEDLPMAELILKLQKGDEG